MNTIQKRYGMVRRLANWIRLFPQVIRPQPFTPVPRITLVSMSDDDPRLMRFNRD